MGKAGVDLPEEDEPDPVQAGRLSGASQSTHLCSLNLSVDSSSSGEARDEAQEYDAELSPRLNSSITILTIVDLDGGFDNSSEEKECAQDVLNDAERNGYSSKDKETKYDEETQEKRDSKEKETRRRKDVAVVGLANAMTRVAKAQNGDTKEKAKKSKNQCPRINVKESASVFEVLVKADIIVAKRHGKEKAGDKG